MAILFGKQKIEDLTDKITETVQNLPDEELFKKVEYDPSGAERGGYSNYSYWRSTFRMFFKNRTAFFLLVVMALLILFSVVQPYLPNQKDPVEIFNNPETGIQYRNVPPGDLFFFGSNNIGQDLWARIWAGTRTSLFIAFTVAIWQTVIGIIIGALWGYVRQLDRIITEIYNIIDNIPTTIVMILFTYIMRPGMRTIIIALCLTGWVGMALFVRNQIIIIRDREYNLASRCLGTGTYRIVTKNLLPYLVSVIMMRVALSIPGTISSEVFLTYIGLGLPISMPSLGNLLNEGRLRMLSASQRYQLWFPLVVLSLITISFYIIGNAFADAADPKNHV
jgi:oligopeptide transport system permease protein